MEKVTAIQKEGIDVEYGEFKNDWIPDGFFDEYNAWLPVAYYYNRNVNDSNIDIESESYDAEIFFVSGSIEDYFLNSISLRLSKASPKEDTAITKENFFRFAASYYADKFEGIGYVEGEVLPAIYSPEDYYFAFTGVKERKWCDE